MTAIDRHQSNGRIVVGALVAAAICIGAGSAQAQQGNANAYSDLSQYLISGNQIAPTQSFSSATPATAGLSSTVVQLGQANVASVVLSGAANVTGQYQTGSNNSSTLSINGTQNAVTTTQIGNSNTTAIDVAGNGNNISNLQVGSGLSYQLQVVGKSVPVSVQQFGSGKK